MFLSLRWGTTRGAGGLLAVRCWGPRLAAPSSLLREGGCQTHLAACNLNPCKAPPTRARVLPPAFTSSLLTSVVQPPASFQPWQVPPAQARVHPPSHPRAAALLPPASHPVPRGHRRRGGAAGTGQLAAVWSALRVCAVGSHLGKLQHGRGGCGGVAGTSESVVWCWLLLLRAHLTPGDAVVRTMHLRSDCAASSPPR